MSTHSKVIAQTDTHTGKLSLIKFLPHINYIIPLPEVQSTSGPFDGFLTCVQRNMELVMMMSSRIMTSLL